MEPQRHRVVNCGWRMVGCSRIEHTEFVVSSVICGIISFPCLAREDLAIVRNFTGIHSRYHELILIQN
jgi:hypothetical protein